MQALDREGHSTGQPYHGSVANRAPELLGNQGPSGAQRTHF